jgi:hypothetical protein
MPLERRRSRWKGHVKVDINGMWCKDVCWFHLSQNRFIHGGTSVSTKGGEFLDWLNGYLLLKLGLRPISYLITIFPEIDSRLTVC